jgi:phage-related protein
MRILIQKVIATFREAIDAIIKTLGFDPSGQISYYWSLGKKIIRRINEITELIAEAIEAVLEWVFFAKMIKELIDWILSLPDKLKSLLADCVKNFTNSIKQIATSVQSIPDQIANLTKSQAQSIANEFNAAVNYYWILLKHKVLIYHQLFQQHLVSI